MKKTWGCILLLCFAAAACVAQNNQAAAPPTVTLVLDRALTSTEKQVVPLAEAIPEDKYDFAPSNGEFKGVRTVSQELLHLAAANYVFAAMLTGDKPNKVNSGDDMTNGPADIKGKAAVVEYLKGSFAAAHKGVATINEKNLLEMCKFPFADSKLTRLYLANIFAWHSMDHYGQLVVYSRMNGVVPPASQPKK